MNLTDLSLTNLESKLLKVLCSCRKRTYWPADGLWKETRIEYPHYDEKAILLALKSLEQKFSFIKEHDKWANFYYVETHELFNLWWDLRTQVVTVHDTHPEDIPIRNSYVELLNYSFQEV